MSPCDDDTTLLLQDCYLLEERERLQEEWTLFREQKKNFEKERRSFTEAAIRLGLEVLGKGSPRKDELRLSSFTVIHTKVKQSNSICLLTAIEKDHSCTV